MHLIRRLAAAWLMVALVAMPAAVGPARATVNTSANKTIVLGNGAQTQFTFNFIGVAAAYISVVLTDSSGNETVLVRGAGSSQYQIVLNAPVAGAIWGVGGTVTYNPSGTPIPSGSSLTIFRTLPLTQAITLQNQSSIQTLGKGAETGLDTSVMQSQQISENIARAIVVPLSDPTPPAPLPTIAQRANQGAAFDSNGNLVAGGTPASGFISSAMQPVVGAASLAAGRAVFGLGNVAVENIGCGLQDDGAGNLRVSSALTSVAINQSVDVTFCNRSFIATGPITFTLARANTLYSGFNFTIYAFTGSITLAPDANDNFPGQAGGASFIIPAGAVARVTTDAAATGAWYVQLVPQVQTAPQGYLTPCSATVVVSGCTVPNLLPTSDVTAATTLYYQAAPAGNQIPVWNGATMVMVPFPELALTLNSNHLANTIYDVCVTLAGAGAPIVVTAPAWQTSTAGSGARGTAAAIARRSGYWVNNIAITGRNGASTYSIPANQCTVVATILIDSTPGQVTFHRSYGQSRKWGAWNFYNRLPIYLKGGDPLTNWFYNTNTIHPVNGNTTNSLAVLTGLPEETFDLVYAASLTGSINTNQTLAGLIGIGYNSTTATFGKIGQASLTNSTASPLTTIVFQMRAEYFAPPALGLQTITALESGLGATVATWNGNENFMLLSAMWRG